MNKSGFVIANKQAEYLAYFRDIGGAILRGWCNTPEKALRFQSTFSAKKAIKKSGITCEVRVLQVWESKTQIAVERSVEAWGSCDARKPMFA